MDMKLSVSSSVFPRTFSAFPASTIALPLLPARGTIPQSLRAAYIVDPRLVRFADHLLPNLPSPFPELFPDDPQLVRDLLQPLPDRVDRPP